MACVLTYHISPRQWFFNNTTPTWLEENSCCCCGVLIDNILQQDLQTGSFVISEYEEVEKHISFMIYLKVYSNCKLTYIQRGYLWLGLWQNTFVMFFFPNMNLFSTGFVVCSQYVLVSTYQKKGQPVNQWKGQGHPGLSDATLGRLVQTHKRATVT